MEQAYGAYEVRRQLDPGHRDDPPPGQGGDRAGRPDRACLLGAATWTGVVLILGAALHFFVALIVTFDATSDASRAEQRAVSLRRFLENGLALKYLLAVGILAGALLPIAALARRGGGRFRAFLVGGLGGLLTQGLALLVAISGSFDAVETVLDLATLAEIVAIPAALLATEWRRARRGAGRSGTAHTRG